MTDRPLVVSLFSGVAVGRLRAQLPGCDVLAISGTRAARADVERAIRDRRVWALQGYSAGCHGVRELLDLGPDVVLTVDGTHASMPGRPQTMPLAPWQALAERARAGGCLWLASHTYNTYTEQLRDGPYRSTVGVLREVSGALLPMPRHEDAPTILRMPSISSADGATLAGIVIASFDSTSCDKAAHARQIWNPGGRSGLDVLVDLAAPVLGDAAPVGPSLGRRIVDGVAAFAGALVRSVALSPLTYAEALVGAAQLSLAEGVAEGHAKNTGAVIDGWLGAVGAAHPANWCAAALAFWLREAEARTGIARPVKGSAGAKATMAQFQSAGRWLTVAQAAGKMRPGLVPVWHRGKPGDWTGHIGVVERGAPGDAAITTIEGNSGPNADRVARMTRRLDDPLLLGFGVT